MTRIYRAHTLPESLPARLADEGVKLVTLDLDKVLAPYRDASVYDDAPGFVDALRAHDITPVIATNSRNTVRLSTVSKRLGGITIFYPRKDTPEGMRRKPSADMLRAAREYVQPEGAAAHVDDQLKALISARNAGFESFVWLKPRGGIMPDHPATVALRPLEAPARGLLALAGMIQLIG